MHSLLINSFFPLSLKSDWQLFLLINDYICRRWQNRECWKWQFPLAYLCVFVFLFLWLSLKVFFIFTYLEFDLFFFLFSLKKTREP
uniref:Uncharacterized protein n=1 Tax=Anguilla anguilla TaxID=7936 RepID=A0A0E9VI71_ANGAN